MNESIITFFEKLLNLPRMIPVQNGKLLKTGDQTVAKNAAQRALTFIPFFRCSFSFYAHENRNSVVQLYGILLDFSSAKRTLSRNSKWAVQACTHLDRATMNAEWSVCCWWYCCSCRNRCTRSMQCWEFYRFEHSENSIEIQICIVMKWIFSADMATGKLKH